MLNGKILQYIDLERDRSYFLIKFYIKDYSAPLSLGKMQCVLLELT